MQLDEFIHQSLVQIAAGVYRANVELTGNEKPTGNIPFLMDISDHGKVNFDVAVTTKSSIEGSGGGKFRIFVVDANADGKASHEHERFSRISFSVGVDKRLGYAMDGLHSK